MQLLTMAHTPTRLASPLEVTDAPLRRGSTVHGPPASTLAHRLAVIRPLSPGRVGLKGSVRTPTISRRTLTARTSPTPGQRGVGCEEGPSNNKTGLYG